MSKFKTAVIGVGYLGKFHADKIDAALDIHRIHPGRHRLQTLLKDGLGEHGPSATLPACARILAPRASAWRASSPNLSSLAGMEIHLYW